MSFTGGLPNDGGVPNGFTVPTMGFTEGLNDGFDGADGLNVGFTCTDCCELWKTGPAAPGGLGTIACADGTDDGCGVVEVDRVSSAG